MRRLAVMASLVAVLFAGGGTNAAVTCGTIATGVGGWSLGAIKQAAENNQCAAFVTDLVGHFGYFRTDNSGYCVDT